MQLKYHMVTIEDLVPQEHFLRKEETVLDLSFVYEETEHLLPGGAEAAPSLVRGHLCGPKVGA